MAVVVGNYCKKGAGERNLAKANIYYIQTRPGRDKQRLTRTLFGPGGSIGRREAYQFITDAPKGTLFYRLKLSPDPAQEDSKRDLNMQTLTRFLMQRLEKRLKSPIPWAAALHDDHTNIRHCHILAAIPRRLHTYDLEFLIREATEISLAQRRFLDRGVSRLPWQKHALPSVLKTGKYTTYRASIEGSTPITPYMSAKKSIAASVPQGGRPARIDHDTCTCPRCHYPQAHNKHAGSHQCAACGIMLHKKRELSLQRTPRKGRGLDRSR